MLDHLLLIKVLAESFSLELEIRTRTFFFLFDKGQNHKFENTHQSVVVLALLRALMSVFKFLVFTLIKKEKKSSSDSDLGKMILLRPRWSSGFTRLGFS
jgi:hypothetical protein